MARPLAVATVLILAGAFFAGCIQSSADNAAPISAQSVDMTNYAAPTGAGTMGYLDSYVMTHPFRLSTANGGALPTMVTARDSLAQELESFGLRVERHVYSDRGTNILAFQEGTVFPDEYIVLSAHYDTTESTVYGAWDDGAGTAMLLELAKSGATRTYRHTIVYAFFDEEEQGLRGSAAFVADYQSQATLVANINFDPPGLNWPCKDAQGFLPLKIIFNDKKTNDGLPGYLALKTAVLAGLDAAAVPAEVRDFSPGIPIATLAGIGLRGTSDHASFDKVDVPNVFIGSAPTSTAGPAAALSYALHTPIDTKEQMVARCGGADLLEQAFDVELLVTTTALDLIDGA